MEMTEREAQIHRSLVEARMEIISIARATEDKDRQNFWYHRWYELENIIQFIDDHFPAPE